MKIHLAAIVAPLAVLGVLGLAACSDSPTSPGTGTIQVRMTDAPGDFEAVNIVVEEVSVHRGDTADSLSGWEVISSGTATYNLLTLQNGVFATLGQTTLPAGRYTQVRLKVGAGSTVTVGGIAFPITIPSGMQSGIKLTGNFDVPANGLLDLALDFDAQRSIILTGNGTYKLKPTIRVLPFSTAGTITGSVTPVTSTTVYALQGADTLEAASTNSLGQFTLSALAAGSYSVALRPVNTAVYRDTTFASVSVASQATTSLGVVALTPR